MIVVVKHTDRLGEEKEGFPWEKLVIVMHT
jgi:hypothetical protein